jgi:N4-gp56 family major capsid protein
MAEVQLATASEKQKWLSKYYAEYVRASGFMPYMGRSPNSIINVKYELQEEAGKTINIPLITRLKGNGVTGSTALDGNEEELGNFNCAISVDWRRNGVRVPKSTSFKTEIDLWGAGKEMLKLWESEKLRDDIISALGSAELGVAWSASNAAARNLWLTSNSDRVLFGAVLANGVSGVVATALATLDTTADKMSAALGSFAKRIAKAADPHIRPFRTESGREYFVDFIGSRAMRDLKADPVITAANRDARAREGQGMEENPLFQDGDQIYDGVIYREVPEIDTFFAGAANGFDGAGTAGADTRPCFLCGAQSAAVAWGQEPQFQTDLQKDYKFRPGVAIEELLGVRKLIYPAGVAGVNKQTGMVTHFVAAAPDA